jgi:hypothetical protein
MTSGIIKTLNGSIGEYCVDLRRSSPTRRMNLQLLIFVAVIALCVGFFAWQYFRSPSRGIDTSRYQLVTLQSGERYIGKLSGLGDSYATLKDVYYQQTNTPTANASDKSTEITVVRLSDSIAKPDNTMHIAKGTITHWENLSSDSKIVQAITQGK